MSPKTTEIKDRKFELLHNFLDNYKTAHYTTAHCWGQHGEDIQGNMYAFHLEMSRGPNYNWISVTVYLSQDEIPTCVYTVKNHHGQPCQMDTILFVYKPKEKDDWKKILEKRIKTLLNSITNGIPIYLSHGFARLIKAEIPLNLNDYNVLRLNLQAKKDDNPVPYANEKENLDKVFVFSEI